LRGKGSIGSEILEKILAKYSDLSLIWLVTGEDQMILSDLPSPGSAFREVEEDVQDYVLTVKQTMQLLREKIILLEASVADKEKIITMLESRVEPPKK